MVAQMLGPYQVAVDLVSYWFQCANVWHAGFFSEMNVELDRIGKRGGAKDDVYHITGSIVAWYGNMARLDISLSKKAVPHL